MTMMYMNWRGQVEEGVKRGCRRRCEPLISDGTSTRFFINNFKNSQRDGRAAPEFPQELINTAWIEYPHRLKKCAKSRRGLFLSSPLVIKGQTSNFLLEERLNWQAAIGRANLSNFIKAFYISPNIECLDANENACRIRHPATEACHSNCTNFTLNERALSRIFCKTTSMNRVEFLVGMLGVQFVVINNAYDGQRQLRILSSCLKAAIPCKAPAYDIEHSYGVDVTEDILQAMQAYTHASYVDAKSGGQVGDQVCQSDFVQSRDFDYINLVGFACDIVADDAVYVGLEHDSNVPKGLIDELHNYRSIPNPRNDPEMVKLDERVSQLLKSVQRLAVYRDYSDSCHFGVLVLLRKFLNCRINEERERISKTFELTVDEKTVLSTEQYGERETSEQRRARISLLQLHGQIKQATISEYRAFLQGLLKRLWSIYLEFMSPAGCVSVDRRIEFILKFSDTRSDEFLQIRRKQYEFVINQSELNYDLAFYSKKPLLLPPLAPPQPAHPSHSHHHQHHPVGVQFLCN
jgi:hypothetical protein